MCIPAALVLTALFGQVGPPNPALPAPAPTPPVAHELPAVGAFDVSDEDLLKGDNAPTDGPGLLKLFRRHAVQAGDDVRIKKLVRQLGDDDFGRREDASLQLTGLGLRARPFLQNALFSPDVEIAHRARECLKQIDESSSAAVMAAAVRVLAKLRPEGATTALLDYLPSAGDESLAEGVRLALCGLAVRDGKADAVLVGALTDRSAEKRGAAAYALGRAAVAEQLPAVRRLLQDPEPLVRYRAALGLATARDKRSVPVLIGLLGELPPPEAGRVEELLYRIADDKAPPAPASSDAALRYKYRDSWKAWWEDNGAKVDDVKLADAARTLGYTLVILLDQGRVLELDAANQTRLEVEQLEFPLDAQILPHDHVLVAEHGGNRVTERDAKGAVVWEHRIEGPLAAQRLPNGDTFIATRTEVVELKPNGDELFSFDRPNGEIIMKAQKLADGDIAMIVQLGIARFVLLDPKGKELRSFNVDLKYSGGRIDVLPNGNVLVPEADNNRVVELDEHGGVVWEVGAEQPIAAVRLPNGHTLITSMSEHRAVEVDHDGKEVWQFRQDTRVTRAFRR